MIDKKIAYLDYLYYEKNNQRDIYLQVHIKEGICTKWHHYLDVRYNKWFMRHVNHRTILNSECVLDFDGEDAEERYYDAIQYLQGPKTFMIKGWTAYRGTYHIHLYIPELMYLNKEYREKKRLTIITFFDADKQKCSDRCMIAMEYAPHWKRGIIKDVFCHGGE